MLQTRMSAVLPTYHPLLSFDRELGPMRLLSDLRLENHFRGSVSGDIEHFCVSYMKTLLRFPLKYWPGSSFASILRRALSALDAFGPPNASYRRVLTMRHLLTELLQSISKDPHSISTAVNMPGGTLWTNMLQLTHIVLQFVLGHGFLSLSGWDHLPQSHELLPVGSVLPAPPRSGPLPCRDAHSDYYRPWRCVLGEQVRVHARCGLQGESSVVLEDGELLKELALTLKEIKWHRYEAGLEAKHVDKQHKAANEVYNLVAAVLAVFVGCGFGLGSSTLPSPRTPLQIRKTFPLSPSLFPSSAELADKLSKISQESDLPKLVANLKSVLNDKGHKKAIAFLSTTANEPPEGYSADALEVFMEGTLTSLGGAHLTEQEPCHLQLTGSSLRYILGDCSSALMLRLAREEITIVTSKHQRSANGPKPQYLHTMSLSSIRFVKLLPRETNRNNKQAVSNNEFLYPVLIASENHSLIVSLSQEEELHEWVGAISIAVARERFEVCERRGNVLQGLQVFVSEQFAGKMDTLHDYRSVYLPSLPKDEERFSLLLNMTDVSPLFVHEANCVGCKHAFNIISRRTHHCRRCGHSFCSKCSSQRFKLHTADEVSRVCHSCFKTLMDREKVHKVVLAELLK